MRNDGWPYPRKGVPQLYKSSGYHRLQPRNDHYGAASTLFWSALLGGWYTNENCHTSPGSVSIMAERFNYVGPAHTSESTVGDLENRLAVAEQAIVNLQKAAVAQPVNVVKLTHADYTAAWLAGARAMQNEIVEHCHDKGWRGMGMGIRLLDPATIKAKYDDK